ncbi:MAG: DNA-binding response regulator [Cytophagaceae bacterium]|jgi:DNA-binding response OmpR family regulator|nr:DNA-binding response regulator [Cytophagaceae bacterium]
MSETELGKEEKEFSILVVEDHVEMLDLLASVFSSNYILFTASDGTQGYELAKSEIPDLILTDVSMPGMDGMEFCSAIRSTLETSHIPVIMITAKAMDEDQLRGYEKGATDYIVKPFNVSILQLKVRNMLDGLKRIREKFSFKELSFEKFTFNELDADWLKRIKKMISEQYTDSTLSVEEIAQEVGMSKSTLYRKLKSLTGKSALDLLQEYRLAQAYELILKSDWNVSEIAYAVGYTDPGYFSQRFKEFYGVSPSTLDKRKG